MGNKSHFVETLRFDIYSLLASKKIKVLKRRKMFSINLLIRMNPQECRRGGVKEDRESG